MEQSDVASALKQGISVSLFGVQLLTYNGATGNRFTYEALMSGLGKYADPY